MTCRSRKTLYDVQAPAVPTTDPHSGPDGNDARALKAVVMTDLPPQRVQQANRIVLAEHPEPPGPAIRPTAASQNRSRGRWPVAELNLALPSESSDGGGDARLILRFGSGDLRSGGPATTDGDQGQGPGQPGPPVRVNPRPVTVGGGEGVDDPGRGQRCCWAAGTFLIVATASDGNIRLSRFTVKRSLITRRTRLCR